MGKLKNRVGEKYGRLLVVKRAPDQTFPNGHKSVVWTCMCECGNKVDVNVNNLRLGHVKSCGCICLDNPNATKHGLYKNNRKLYTVWTNLKQRCTNPKNPNYKNYGGRGICVCDEWQNSFENFCLWALSHGYKYYLTIDRIDNNGNYEPNNCRWVSRFIQRHNQRRLDDWMKLFSEWDAGNIPFLKGDDEE